MDERTPKGTLYGVSVGPGDPELITLKALRCIRSCPVIAAPQTAAERMLALEIAQGAADLTGKQILPLRFPMSRDAAVLAAAHRALAEQLQGYLDRGQDVALLTLGDVSVYSTYSYLEALLRPLGYPAVRIPGVPSFCAAAARLGQDLTGGMNQPLTIAPGPQAEAVLDAPGSKVLMKTGRQLPAAVDALRRRGLLEKSALVSNCGLPEEAVCPSLSGFDPAQPAGYFATIIVKE